MSIIYSIDIYYIYQQLMYRYTEKQREVSDYYIKNYINGLPQIYYSYRSGKGLKWKLIMSIKKYKPVQCSTMCLYVSKRYVFVSDYDFFWRFLRFFAMQSCSHIIFSIPEVDNANLSGSKQTTISYVTSTKKYGL